MCVAHTHEPFRAGHKVGLIWQCETEKGKGIFPGSTRGVGARRKRWRRCCKLFLALRFGLDFGPQVRKVFMGDPVGPIGHAFFFAVLGRVLG